MQDKCPWCGHKYPETICDDILWCDSCGAWWTEEDEEDVHVPDVSLPDDSEEEL